MAKLDTDNIDKDDLTAGLSKEDFVKLANQMGRQAKSMVNDKQEELEKIANSFGDMIREKPIKSVLTGFIAGVVLGKIFSK